MGVTSRILDPVTRMGGAEGQDEDLAAGVEPDGDPGRARARRW